MAVVYVGVGSNIDPELNVPRALDELSAHGIRVVASSTFYRTEPIGRPEQDPYANGVFRLNADRTPAELRASLREVERSLGRMRTRDKFAPRSIDLDILLFGELVMHADDMTIPDPHIFERPFLAKCLLELDPDLRLPGHTASLRELAVGGRSALVEYGEITRLVREKLEVP